MTIVYINNKKYRISWGIIKLVKSIFLGAEQQPKKCRDFGNIYFCESIYF